MYFSNFNNKITYSNEWGGVLHVCGEGTVVKEDTSVSPGSFKDLLEYKTLQFDQGITSVGAGFIEKFKDVHCLIICRSVKSIGVSVELRSMLGRNSVLVRGWKGTFAERFSSENGLLFRQADIMIGWSHGDYCNTKLTLRFPEKGGPYFEYDDYCSGISAGNNGGGTYTREIEKGFFDGMSLGAFAECLPRFSGPILKNADLDWFLKHR